MELYKIGFLRSNLQKKRCFMASTRKDHPINSADFYSLSKDELDYIRRIKARHYIPFVVIGFAIIIIPLFFTIIIGRNFHESVIPFLLFSSIGWVFLIVTFCQIFRHPEGGHYATIESCYTTEETTGIGEDQSTSTYYHFTVRFDDTSEIFKNFIGSMYAKSFRTGSRVFVVKNKISNYDVFPAEPLIDSGVYSPPIVSDEKSEINLSGGETRNSFIDDIGFYQLSESDIQSIKDLRKKQFKTLFIIIAFLDLIPIICAIIMTASFGSFFITVIIVLIILVVTAFVIGCLFKKLLTKNPGEEYSARHVIITDKRTESVMYSSGESTNTIYYSFETTDTHEILSNISLDDTEALNRKVGTEVILAKNKKGTYKIFNI